MKPDNQTINDTLAGIARATDTHPTPLLARQKVAEFRLDREKGEKPLGLATRTSGSGAPLLDVNRCIQCSLPNHAPIHGRSTRRLPWWLRWLRIG